MTGRPDGGAAFPLMPPIGSGEQGYPYPEEGMTLRDWFAGQALGAMAMAITVATTEALERAAKTDRFSGTVDDYMAKRSYAVADAMLAERLKVKP